MLYFYCKESSMKITNEELEKKKKQIKELGDEFFSLSKNDNKGKELLLEKMRKLENEIQSSYNKLKNI